MKILITNDDGLHASQLVPLIQWAQKLGEVTTVVPKYEQSGKSHGIEIHKPFEVTHVELAPGITAIAVDSTPADCVRYAILGMHEKFDLVISGINKGLNMGRDIMYSGTVGAVLEAGNLGVQAIAFSTEPKDAGSIRITRQGGPYYSDEFISLDNNMVSPHGIEVFVPCGNMEIDTDAVLCGKLISIMPLTLEKTDLQVFGELKYLNN